MTASHAPRCSEAPATLAALAGARARPGIETAFDVERDALFETLRSLRDEHGYQQLMEIAGVDYPERAERFEVVYCLLSLTHNHRLRVHVRTDEATPLPSATALWPVAGWLEREVYDMFGVVFSGNKDLRRILTDYGFEGFPLRKDFPQTGYVELRYSEAEKRVVYEPVGLPQDFRNWDFLMPWQGAEYRLPGDEKAEPQQPGAPSPAPANASAAKVEAEPAKREREAGKPYAADNEDRAQAGAGTAQAEARKPAARKAKNAGGRSTGTPDPKPGDKA